jgi:hypothetical protein
MMGGRVWGRPARRKVGARRRSGLEGGVIPQGFTDFDPC